MFYNKEKKEILKDNFNVLFSNPKKRNIKE